MGRPSDYTPEIATRLCESLADGQSLRALCSAENMPDKSTVFRWLSAHEEFRDQYARAREWQADSHADDVVFISDTEEDPARARVRIDARKWAAGKQNAPKYGDKVDLNHGGQAGNPVTIRSERVIVDPANPDS